MFAILRSLAPAVLLLASLSGQAATGMVLAHVASEHAVSESHGDHHAADHHSEAEGEPAGSDPGSQHTHQIVPATAAAPARLACPSSDVQPSLAVVGPGRLDRPAPGALHHAPPPGLGAGPPEPQRHPIRLL